MILYEYRCIACQNIFTARRPMARCNDPATCPHCGAAGRRIISRPQRAGVPVTMEPEQVRRSEEVWS